MSGMALGTAVLLDGKTQKSLPKDFWWGRHPINKQPIIWITMSESSKQCKGKQRKVVEREKSGYIVVWSGKTSLQRWHLSWDHSYKGWRHMALDTLLLMFNAKCFSMSFHSQLTTLERRYWYPAFQKVEDTEWRWLNELVEHTELGLHRDCLTPKWGVSVS